MKICKNNAKFFFSNLKSNLRLDGRNFEDSRNISIYFFGNYGSVEISIGYTKAICKITSEVVKPFEKKPNEGIIKVNLDIDSFTSVNDNSKINDESLEIRNLIERILKSGNIINFESLCIIPHKKVWCLLINIIVIESDGNLSDACYLSAYSALSHFRNNEVKIENSDIIINQDESNHYPLSIHNSPILTTFAFFNDEDACLIDPSLIEEEFMSSKLSIALNGKGKLINILKPGGSPISYLKILEAIEISKKRVQCILKILEDALEEDKNLRCGLKAKNLHVKYSCNPESIKYDSNYLQPRDIPISQLLRNSWSIEQIIKKYEKYVQLQDVQNEEDLISGHADGSGLERGAEHDAESNNINGNKNHNRQYLLNEEICKIKNQCKSERQIHSHSQNQNIIKPENNLYACTYKDYVENIEHSYVNLQEKNKNSLYNFDTGKIKRQESFDTNSYSHNIKFLKTNNIQKKEVINFSNPVAQSINTQKGAQPLYKNVYNNKSIHIKSKNETQDKKEDSSDIDFSVAISENLKKKKKKVKKKT